MDGERDPADMGFFRALWSDIRDRPKHEWKEGDALGLTLYVLGMSSIVLVLYLTLTYM